MTGNSSDDFVIRNQAALEELAWSIEMSQGQFTLLLARCNYATLRQQIVAQVQEHCTVPIRVVTLPETATTLYTSLKAELGEEQPQAVMVFGLEAVQDLEQTLASTNQVREEFRKAFPFPLVLWVTDEVSKQLIRLAPDFHSWSTATEFLIATDTLLASLRQGAENLFETLLTPASPLSFARLWANFTLGDLQRSELETALTDLHDRGQSLEPELQASLDLVRGLEAGIRSEALTYLERSLRYWQQAGDQFPLRVGLLLFFVGRYHFYATEQERSIAPDWSRARQPLQECLEIFEQENRPDLVAKCTTQLERVLEKSQDWDKLEQLAQRSLPLQQRYGSLSRLAQDYRYLAEVALHRSQSQIAHQWAQQAWETLQRVPEDQRWAGSYLLTLARAEKGLGNQERAIETLECAEQLGDQGMPRLYIAILEELRQIYLEQKHYLDAFKLKQRRMSTEQAYSIQAFVGAGWLKPRREEVGAIDPTHTAMPAEAVAPEIEASGRQRDLDKLLERIGRNDYKLIVVHGFSGVGKSSLVTAGLVPALKQKSIGIQENLPVLVRKYTNWQEELAERLIETLAAKQVAILDRILGQETTEILEQLRWNEQRNLRTVLIFDQFEEFFFVYPDLIDRKRFFEFLGDCLQILSVKVILSLREDYLHYLLECSRLSNIAATGIDILSRNVLYGLGNFSPADARAIIQDRTSRSQFYLEPDLVEAVVQDLAGELGEVRPIELQVVGAQLQAEDITTLEPYRALGENPKQELVKRYLAEVVQDCGIENRQIAELVLYLLTDEKGTRPLKTRPELELELEALVAEVTENPEQLNLVLKILVDSGLVVLLPELPLDRYQLVHDYLAVFIQQQQTPRLGQLIIELDEERKQRLAIEEKKKAIELELQQTEQARQALENAHQEARQILEEARIAARLERESINILKKFESSQLEALLQATRSAKSLQALVKDNRSLEDYPTIRPIETLRTILANIQQRNQIKVQSGAIFRVLFSPDAEKVATLRRGIAELWSVNGKKLAEFSKHGEHCNDMSFSPDGRLLATAGQNDIVQLWHPSGQLITEFQGHHGQLRSIRFTLDGKQVATGGRDGYVRFWNLDGQLLSEFKAYLAHFLKLRCSPNAQEIATIGGWLNTIHLWDLKGKQVAQFSAESKTTQEVTNFGLNYLWDEETKTLVLGAPLKNSPAETAGLKEGDRIVAIEGKAVQDADFRQKLAATSEAGLSLKIQRHNEEFNVLLQRAKYRTIVPVSFQSISFSPDGEQIASVANDGFVRIWNRNGEHLNEFKAHPTVATDVSFSPDGQQIATVSYDGTTRVWSQSGQGLIQFRGHQGRTFSVNFSLDGNRVATASGDGTISIWNLAKPKVYAVKVLGEVSCVNLSPNSYYLAASDNTGRNVGIWNFEGRQISELVGHFGRTRCITFNPTGELIATGGEDKTTRLWNLEGKQLAQFEGHQELVFGVTFSPNGQQIATASGDSTARLWDLAGTQLVEFTGHEGSVWKARFSPDGHYLATAGGDGTVRLWDLSGQQLTVFTGHRGVVWDVAFSPDGRYLATAGGDGTARLWDLSGQQLQEFGEYHSHLDKVYFSPNGKILVTVAHQGPVWIWSLSGLLLTELRDQVAEDVHFREDSQQIIIAGEDGYIRFISLEYPTLEESIEQGCCWLKDYLTNNLEVTNDDRALCNIPPRNTATHQED